MAKWFRRDPRHLDTAERMFGDTERSNGGDGGSGDSEVVPLPSMASSSFPLAIEWIKFDIDEI